MILLLYFKGTERKTIQLHAYGQESLGVSFTPNTRAATVSLTRDAIIRTFYISSCLTGDIASVSFEAVDMPNHFISFGSDGSLTLTTRFV